MWQQLFLIVGILAMACWAFCIVRKNPGAFSMKNFGKSLHVLGIIAILLIAMIALCIWILRMG